MRRLGQVLVVLGGLLAIASAYVHGFFARPVVMARAAAGVDAATLAGLNAAWWLGTLAMAAFGLVALAGVGALGREGAAARTIAIAGAFFVGYGTWAYGYRHHPHFAGFIAIGLLMIAGGVLAKLAPPKA